MPVGSRPHQDVGVVGAKADTQVLLEVQPRLLLKGRIDDVLLLTEAQLLHRHCLGRQHYQWPALKHVILHAPQRHCLHIHIATPL